MPEFIRPYQRLSKAEYKYCQYPAANDKSQYKDMRSNFLQTFYRKSDGTYIKFCNWLTAAAQANFSACHTQE